MLISSLKEAKTVSRQELNTLYCWRWHVELDFRAIKSVMQMDVLRCKTPEMVIMEVAAHLLAYNLVRSVMAQSARQAGCLPRQLSFKGALQQLRAFEEQLRHGAYNRVVWLCEVLMSPFSPTLRSRTGSLPVLLQFGLLIGLGLLAAPDAMEGHIALPCWVLLALSGLLGQLDPAA
jgi:hypothetical protein